MSVSISGEPLQRDADDAWHALFTRHQHEKVVAHILSSKGFEVFLPLYSSIHQWKDRNKQLYLPLFPSYVFLRGGLRRRLDILTTPGVHFVVANGSRFADIPEEEITAVRKIVERTARVEPHPFLKCGDRVRVKYGPLTGIEGILIRKRNGFRLVVSVELLGRSVAAEIDASSVERVSARNAKEVSRWGLTQNTARSEIPASVERNAAPI